MGRRRHLIDEALAAVRKSCGTIQKISRIIDTAPVGPATERFLNGAFILTTNQAPQELLQKLLKIEKNLGRVRTIKWGDRPIDLDIILAKTNIGPLQCFDDDLKIPHPHCLERDFVLIPCQEIAPEWIHPISGNTIREEASRFISVE